MAKTTTRNLDRAIVTGADESAVREHNATVSTKRGTPKTVPTPTVAKVRTVAAIAKSFSASESNADKHEDKMLEFKVQAARQYFELASHPSIRNKNGTPNKSAASRALGKDNASSHRLYWDAAVALDKLGRAVVADVKDVSADDLEVARAIWAAKAELSKANRESTKDGTKGKGKDGTKGKGKGETVIPSVESINGALDAVANLIGAFYADAAFTDEEQSKLIDRLSDLSALVESNGAADDADADADADGAGFSGGKDKAGTLSAVGNAAKFSK